jgi:hypothetical protein
MKKYYISVDLDVSGIEAHNEGEALKIANEYINEGRYTLDIADVDEIDDEEKTEDE